MIKIRPDIAALHGYAPGLQPDEGGWVKLNTNESPRVAPGVLARLRAAVTDAVRLYPNPTSEELRARLAERHGAPPQAVIVGNGSDDVLNLIIRAVCAPGAHVAAPHPSYSLYPVLAAIQGAATVHCPLGPQFELPVRQLAAARGAVTFVASPNNPAGTAYGADELRWLAARTNLLVIDEAYAEFADEDRAALARELPNVCVTRSFSKAFGLAGLRLGYALGPPAFIDVLHCIKDSYNVSRLAQAAGAAALDEIAWAEAQWQATRVRREDFAKEIRRRFGLTVYPSAANFVFVECAPYDAEVVQRELAARRILVRRFADEPRIANGLRVSIGSDADMQAVLAALADILAAAPVRADGR